MDKDGYPTPEELQSIRDWPVVGFGPTGNPAARDLMDYIKERWRYADEGSWNEDEHGSYKAYSIHTTGWSGNEDIIAAMADNVTFWALHWQYSKRGGHYKFEVTP